MRRPRPYWVLAAVAGVLTWGFTLAVPGPGLDPSWIAALHMAARDGTNFGTELTFVYGPLGFLAYPHMFFTGTALLALLANAVLFFGSLALVARSMWRAFPPWAAIALTMLLAGVSATLALPERLEAVFGILCLAFVLDEEDRLTPGRAAALGLLVAVTALVKLSSGTVSLVLLAVLLAVAAIRQEDRREALRAVAAGAAGVLGGVVVLWLATRQNLADLPDYVSQGRDLVSGYADAVSIEEPGRGWEYWAAAVAGVLLAWSLVTVLRPLDRLSRVGGALVVLLLAWITFRHGFTRHDGHSFLFFGTMLLVTPLLAERGRPVVAVALGIALSVGALSKHTPWDALRFSTNTLVDTAWTLASSDKRTQAREGARSALKPVYGVSPVLLGAMRGHSVHIDPWESEIAWVHQEIDWHPVPMLQPYTAYTGELDDLNARALESPSGPEMILRENNAVDRRDPRWESPDYMVTMVCRYREVSTQGRWQLVQRAASRCGRPRPEGSSRVSYGEAVDVPAPTPDDFVVARFTDIDESLGSAVRGLVFKRHELYAGVGDGRVSRFLAGHAANRHLMSVPACLGWNPALIDYTTYPVVALGHGDGTLTTLRSGSRLGAGEGTYEVSFERIPFACPRRALTRSPGGRAAPRRDASPSAPER